MSIVDQLKHSSHVRSHTPLSGPMFERLEHQIGSVSQSDIRELLKFASVFEFASGLKFDLTGNLLPFQIDGVFNRVLPIASTETGDYWVIDILSDGCWSHIFFCSHNAPSLSIQFETVFDLLKAALDQRPVVDQHLVNESAGAKGASVDVTMKSDDTLLKEFGSRLPLDATIYDLRLSAKLRGMPFVPSYEYRRAGDHLVFGLWEEKRVPKESFFTRLFRR